MKKIKTILMLLILTGSFFGVFFQVNAAPIITSISGSIVDGESIGIDGNNFKNHQDFDDSSEYLNYIFEDCEQGVIDATAKGWSGWAKIISGSERAGSSYSLFHERRLASQTYINAFGLEVTNNIRYGIKVDIQDVAPIHHYFLSQWIRLSDDFGNIEASVDNQVKLLMTTPFDEIGGKDYFQTRGGTPPPLRTETESGQLSQAHGPIEDYMPYGSWHRMDMWVSVPDTTTGIVDEIKWWIDGKLIRTAKQTDGHLQPNPEDVHKVGLVSFIGYIDNTSDASFSVQTDDHFLDFTTARVEISDSPIWDETVQVHKEIQIPTSWSNNQITVKFNQGSFNNGDQVYLYVIDENGEVNQNGYPITIGNSSSTNPRSDVNQDNQVTSTDAMLTLKNSLGLDMSSTNWVTGAHTGDANCDGITNSTDAMLILRKSLGLNMETTDWCVE